MRILYTGYYGYGNTGDDSFVYITDWQLKVLFPKDEILCLSPNNYGIGVNSVFLSKKMSYKMYLLSLLYYLFRADVLIYSGGTLFRTKYKAFSSKWIINILCRLFQVKQMAIGVSVGPFESNDIRDSWKPLLSRFKVLCLRDKRSFDTVSMMGVKGAHCCFDIAALLPLYTKSNYKSLKYEPKSNTIGLSLCSFAKEEFNDKLLLILEEFFSRRSSCNIYLFVFKSGTNGDENISQKTCQLLSKYQHNCRIIAYDNPIKTIERMLECKMMMCTRLHASIFSYAYKIPFVSFEYEQKCSDFLNEISYPKECRLSKLSVDDLEKAVSALSECYNLFASLNIKQDAAKNNFIELKKALS